LEGFQRQAQNSLETSNDIEEILRSQGEKRGLRKILDNIETIVRSAEGERDE
jgi:hypothetical protein